MNTMTNNTERRVGQMGSTVTTCGRLLTIAVATSLIWACGDPETVDVGDPADHRTEDEFAQVHQALMPDGSSIPVTIVDVETVVVPEVIEAGKAVRVMCQPIDETGTHVVLEEQPSIRVDYAPQATFELTADREFTAIRAGQASFHCSFPQLGIIDTTPVDVEVRPGPVAVLTTEFDVRQLRAGETATATCEAFDIHGNYIKDAEPSLAIDTMGEGITVEGLSLTATKPGLYTASCHIDGVQEEIADTVEVAPMFPASMALAVMPVQRTYAVGQVVSVDWMVADRYDNPIPGVRVRTDDLTGMGEPFGIGRYRFMTEGTHRIAVQVIEATDGDVVLEDELEVVVNAGGPTISCTLPGTNGQVDARPGSNVTLSGRVADANGIGEVRVNGQLASVDGSGNWSLAVPGNYGINNLDIVATDAYGEENSRTCSFLMADDFAPENGFLDDTLTLRLDDSGVNDNNPNDGLDSLNDMLVTVINSQGLKDVLHQGLQSANPLKRKTCDARAPIFGFCVFRSGVDYERSELNGPNDANLQLVSNGLRASATVRDIGVKIDIDGTINKDGWIRLGHLGLDITFGMGLQNNRPKIDLQSINGIDVGRVDLQFGGILGFIIDILEGILQGFLRDLVRDLIRDYIRSSFQGVLDGLVGNLDVSNINPSFAVPRVDGSGSINVDMGVRFSSLSASSQRALFGLGTRINGPNRHAGPSLGVPLPSANIKSDPATAQPIAATVHVGVLNQALHTLWRGGLFDVDFTGSELGGQFPSGARLTASTNLPPVTQATTGGNVRMMVGGMSAELVYPGIFDQPVTVHLGASVMTNMSLSGDELDFGSLSVEDIVFSVDGIRLEQSTRDILEGFLMEVVQNMVDRSLNNALPKLPIPSFTTPASVASFGIPAGSDLGIKNPSLSNTNSHVVLQGAFGTR